MLVDHDTAMGRFWGLEDHAAVRAKCDAMIAKRQRDCGMLNEKGNPMCNYGHCRNSIHRDGLCRGHYNWNRKRRRGKRKRGGVAGIRLGPQRRRR